MRTVPLSGAKAAGRVTRVDDDDFEKVIPHRWWVQERDRGEDRRPSGPYVMGRVEGRRIVSMHNFLMPGVARVDHKDGDGLNNQRRTNLREATAAQNGANSGKRLPLTSSQFKGVSWISGKLRWHATIQVGGISYYLGRFTDEAEAARAYDAAAREHFGEFAWLNFPGEGDK